VEHVAAIAQRALLKRAQLPRVGQAEQEIAEARAGELAVEGEDSARARRPDDVGLHPAQIRASFDVVTPAQQRDVVERLKRAADLVVRQKRPFAERHVSECTAEGEPRQTRYRLRRSDVQPELLVDEILHEWLLVDRWTVVAEARLVDQTRAEHVRL